MDAHRWLFVLFAVVIGSAYVQGQGMLCYSCSGTQLGTSMTFRTLVYNSNNNVVSTTAGVVTTPEPTTTTSQPASTTTLAQGVINTDPTATTTSTAATSTSASTTAAFAATNATTVMVDTGSSGISISIGYLETACTASVCYAGADTCMTAKASLANGFYVYLYACTNSATCNSNYAAQVLQTMYSAVNAGNVVTQCCSSNACNAVPLATPSPGTGSNGAQSHFSFSRQAIILALFALLKTIY